MLVNQNSTTSLISILQSWQLSESAILVLSKEPEVVAKLQAAKELASFPTDYIPNVIEEKFDNINFRRWEYGVLTYERHCSPSYEPPFVEYSFDGQTALFFINGEIIVNRIELMAENIDLANLLNN
jgi:hypothetical protein